MEDIIFNSPEFKACREKIKELKSMKINGGLEAIQAVTSLIELEVLLEGLKPLIADDYTRENSDPTNILKLMIDARDVSIDVMKQLPKSEKIRESLSESRDNLADALDLGRFKINEKIKFNKRNVKITK